MSGTRGGPAADKPGRIDAKIEMATVDKKTVTPSKAERGEAGAASSDPDADDGALRPARPCTLSGRSRPPPEGMPRWGLITIAVFFGVSFLVIGGLFYFFREGPSLDPSRLTGTWRDPQGDEYVIEGTEGGTEVKQKVNSGFKSVGHLSFPTRSTGDRFFLVYWKDYEGDKAAGIEKKITNVAYFDEDKATNEVTYISWSIYGILPEVWIHVERAKAAQEEMRTALDGTWHAMVDRKLTEAKVVRKDGKQVWQEDGAPDSPIELSSDGRLFERSVDFARLTWDGYVRTNPLGETFQTIVWENPRAASGSHPPQWQKAYRVPIDTEKLKGRWFLRPAAGGAWTSLTEDRCYGKVSTSWLSNSATWNHAGVAWKADTVEVLLGEIRRITWTSEGNSAVQWQNKVFDKAGTRGDQ